MRESTTSRMRPSSQSKQGDSVIGVKGGNSSLELTLGTDSQAAAASLVSSPGALVKMNSMASTSSVESFS